MVGGTSAPSIIVIGTAINQLETKVSLKTICCLRLFVVVYKHVTYRCFYQGGKIYMYRNFRSQNLYIFLVIIMDTCIAVIMYRQRLFLLFTGKQYCLHKKIF